VKHAGEDVRLRLRLVAGDDLAAEVETGSYGAAPADDA
jgi:hypothetical protein